jgi:hypothetical protein
MLGSEKKITLFLGKYNNYMGITCNIPVYLPVDQKQCALREDKYIEMLIFFLHLLCFL